MPTIEAIIPSDLRDKFEFHNFGHALEILPQACAEEWKDLLNALRALSIPLAEVTASGGNESAIPKRFDELTSPPRCFWQWSHAGSIELEQKPPVFPLGPLVVPQESDRK